MDFVFNSVKRIVLPLNKSEKMCLFINHQVKRLLLFQNNYNSNNNGNNYNGI